PALPMALDAGPRNGVGDTRRSVPSAPAAVTSVPSARSAPVISSLSRLTRGPRTRQGVADNAASTRARLVIDFEPGRDRRAFTGRSAVGAGQGSSVVDSRDRGDCENADSGIPQG